MILLDTNVISEVLRERPDPGVTDWLDAQDGDRLFLSTVSEAELLYGVAILPEGRRKAALADLLAQVLGETFNGQILAFDSAAADAYAAIAAGRRAAGRPISSFDGQIAAIAVAHHAALATRNVRDFKGCGVDLIDPWAA
ncbi:MAG: PIN domain-containing protein [Oceanicaulis sp.]